MSHGLTGNRSSWWEWTLLDLNDNKVDDLSGVIEGSSSVNLNVNGQTRLVGAATWAGKGSDLLEFTRYHLQPWYVATVNGVEQARWPLGVFLPSTPAVQYGETDNVTVPIQMFDKTLILREDQIPTDIAYPAGTNPVEAIVEQIVLAAGPAAEAQIAIDETTETLRTGMFWTTGTTRLRIVNDLLRAVGYWAIWVDFQGNWRSSPYVRGADRTTEWTFASGEKAIYLPNYELQRDTFKVPNQLVLISQSDADTPGMVSVATNENPAHPFSYQRRGRWISQTIPNVEATSQAVLDAEAKRRLEEMSNVAATVQLTHAPVSLYGHDKVHLSRTGEAALELDGTVQTMSMQDDGLWSTSLREVLPGLEEEVFEE